MARTRKINENMGDLAEAIQEYQGAQATIRAKYALLAEQEITARRKRVLDLMFITHAGAGPSEIANSTGVSRSTVIRWRDEFAASREALIEEGNRVHAEVGAEVSEYSKPVAHDFGGFFNFGREDYDGTPTAYVQVGMDQVWLLTGEDFGEGGTPHEAEDNRIDRPDWLTDELMREAVEATGVRLMLAPWS